jgi:hypothetical protein
VDVNLLKKHLANGIASGSVLKKLIVEPPKLAIDRLLFALIVEVK